MGGRRGLAVGKREEIEEENYIKEEREIGTEEEIWQTNKEGDVRRCTCICVYIFSISLLHV